ncbi:hypothetical protein TSAR_008980 [Trichomalopsis sarcophagae]|uniref:Protein brambleberry n=1 Tax=Trichomalopsis sarcophagae TaxID=543379 RepID=A0A232FCY7_9HYME|nr:hypothetical protein TSAR_008980 [Trichomalopsis sarcophagae]
MMGNRLPMARLFIILLTLTSIQVNAESVLSWLWGSKDESNVVISDGVPLINIPYEMLTEDEKFLKEAAKLVTDIQISSPLEICQHKVVMKIKTSCSSMTEEQLAKLSVNLLNCQSATEGRKVFPCDVDMTIKQCTSSMDADTWNAYHLMSNRARAVCYAARSHQFRALTELTVNKLMQSAHSQIQTLSSLKESQDRLEEQSVAAHKIIESNIEDLTNEKALIKAGHAQLANMTEEIKRKLDKASQELMEQASERGENHQEILKDLENIKIHAQILWDKIESSTNRIIEQNQEAALQYEETLMKLEKINQTINFIWDLTNSMRNEIDKKLGWITEYIGTTGESIDKVYRIVLHVVYLLGAMIAAAFLHAPFLTRSAILGVVPLNLASYLKHGLSACLDFVSLSVLILLITTMHYVMNGIQYLLRPRGETNSEKGNGRDMPAPHTNVNGYANSNGNANTYNVKVKQQPSLVLRIVYGISNFWNSANDQIHQSLDNLKATYSSMKSWIWQKFVPTEELSCSYIPSKKYHDRIVSSRIYPSMSDDSSDYNDTHESPKFVLSDDHSVTGAVLRRKTLDKGISPLTAFFKGPHEPIIRETMHAPLKRSVTPSSQNITPITRPICGARTRSGNPCRLTASRGQNFCHRHATGSSTMGD